MVRTRVGVFALVLAACVVALAGPAAASPVVLRATLTGSEAVPGPGDPNGTGLGYVIVDDDTNRVCVVIWVRNIAPATGAHIHFGSLGQTGGHALDVTPPTNGASVTCSIESEALVDQLLANPGGFYLNIHNAEYHGGAIRGQLQAV